jgi:hypothetical protein
MFVFIVYIDVDYCVYKLHSRPAPLEASSRSAAQHIFCLLEAEISSSYSQNPANEYSIRSVESGPKCHILYLHDSF